MTTIPAFAFGGGNLPAGREPLPNKEDADRLVRTIRFAWASCGHDIEVWVERRIGREDRIEYDIRSNLVNGLPAVRS